MGLGEEVNMTENELLLKLQELENRIEALENARKSKKGVIVTGAPKVVRDYLEEKSRRGGGE